MITREEAEALTAAIQSVDPDDSVNGYFAQLARHLRDDGVELPQVTIEWRNLKSVVQATTSQASLPSLPNVLLLIAKVCTRWQPIAIHGFALCTVAFSCHELIVARMQKLTFQRPKTEPLTILNNLSGVLHPVRLRM